MVETLAADVALYGDGGGKAPAIRQPVYGRDRVGKALLGWWKQGRRVRVGVEYAEVNGQPGAVFRDDQGRILSVLSVDVADGQVQAVRSIVNPAKLEHLGPLGDLQDLFAQLARRGRD